MRIAYLSHLFLPGLGGVEIQIHNLALQLRSAGHEVSVIIPCNSWRDLRSRGIVLPYSVLPWLPRLPSLILRASRRDYDLRWLLGPHWALYQKLYAFDVWHVHSAYPAGFLAISGLKRLTLIASDGIAHTCFPHIVSRIEQILLVPNSDLEWITNHFRVPTCS